MLRAVRAVGIGAALVLVLGGCPPEDFTIRISAQGAKFMADSCQPSGPGPCRENTTFETLAPTQIRVVLLDDQGSVRGASRCADVSLCGFDPGQEACNASRVNDALDSSLADGLTYDGLEDPGTGELVLLVYNDPTSTSTAEEFRCVPEKTFSCARLTLVSGTTFDATCAACVLSESATGAGACNDFLSHYSDACAAKRCRELAHDL